MRGMKSILYFILIVIGFNISFISNAQEVNLGMNHYDSLLLEHNERISKLPWLSHIFKDNSVIVFSVNTGGNFDSSFSLIYKKGDEYKALSIKQQRYEYKLWNIRVLPSEIGRYFEKEFCCNRASAFVGDQFARFGYASYIFITLFCDGIPWYSIGCPIPSWSVYKDDRYKNLIIKGNTYMNLLILMDDMITFDKILSSKYLLE